MSSHKRVTPGSDRLAAMQPSAIRAIHDLAQSIRAADPARSIIPLHFGEADRGTPDFIIEAASQAMRDGAVFYENNSGRPDLKAALVGFYQRLYGVDLTPDQIDAIMTNGLAAALAVEPEGKLATSWAIIKAY